MGIGLWKKPYTLRRFKGAVASGGYVTQDYEDMVVRLDIQTTDKSGTMSEFGDHTVQRIKVFTIDKKTEIKPADEKSGTSGDWVWFQGKWFECRSARLSENTILHHWTCTFVELKNQMPPPKGDTDETG